MIYKLFENYSYTSGPVYSRIVPVDQFNNFSISLQIKTGTSDPNSCVGWLQASNDGKNFTNLARLETNSTGDGWDGGSFVAVYSHMRFRIDSSAEEHNKINVTLVANSNAER